MSQYLPIIALVVSAIALALSILIPVIHSHNNDHWNEKELRDKVVKTVRDSERVEKMISDKVEAKLSRMEKSKSGLPKDEIVNEIIERLKPEIQKIVVQRPLPKSEENHTERDKSGWKRYGFYGKDSFVLTESPTSSTVYCFVCDPTSDQKAWFDVYDVQNVVKDPNLLQDGCCAIEGEGKNLHTLEKGLTVCKGGRWVLEKRLKLKFS